MLDSTHANLDIAMYSFTDLQLAHSLSNLARHGVRVRVYRDAEQFEQEEQRGQGRQTTTEILRSAGIEVRIRAHNELMHLKSYASDGETLRSGSANWSISGLRYQDNDLAYYDSPTLVSHF